MNLEGQKFGKLTVLRFGHILKRRSYWECRCECGGAVTVYQYALRSGKTKSCGCLRRDVLVKRNTTHGKSKHPGYTSWSAMLTRCTNQNQPHWKHYGGRGISVCPEWLSFDRFWKDMGPTWKPGLTIERKNGDKGYQPGNVKWATWKEQQNNTSRNKRITAFGITRTVSQWSDATGIKYHSLAQRLGKLGWTPERALTTP